MGLSCNISLKPIHWMDVNGYFWTFLTFPTFPTNKLLGFPISGPTWELVAMNEWLNEWSFHSVLGAIEWPWLWPLHPDAWFPTFTRKTTTFFLLKLTRVEGQQRLGSLKVRSWDCEKGKNPAAFKVLEVDGNFVELFWNDLDIQLRLAIAGRWDTAAGH